MEKKIVVCIGTDRANNVRARLSLMICEGAKVHSEQYHSISFAPGDDVAAGRASVEKHLTEENSGIPFAPWPAIPDEEWAKVERVCAIFHAP